MKNLLSIVMSVIVTLGVGGANASRGTIALSDIQSLDTISELNVCEIPDCKHLSVHEHTICDVNDCNLDTNHEHSGIIYYGNSDNNNLGQQENAIKTTTQTNCEISSCEQSSIHEHIICDINDCNITTSHKHNGIVYYGRSDNDNLTQQENTTKTITQNNCNVTDCTQTGSHTHNNCDVSGCMQTGNHTHNSCGVSGCTKNESHTHNNNGDHDSKHGEGHH